jgi:hypothetical protein
MLYTNRPTVLFVKGFSEPCRGIFQVLFKEKLNFNRLKAIPAREYAIELK